MIVSKIQNHSFQITKSYQSLKLGMEHKIYYFIFNILSLLYNKNIPKSLESNYILG